MLQGYLAQHNRKFAKPASNSEPVWRKASFQQIEQTLCFKEKRTVAHDNTVTFDGVIFTIPQKSPYRSYADQRIEVHVLLDGAVEFFHKNEKIADFDSKTTHAFGLYRTNKKREGFRYGPMSAQNKTTRELSP